MTLDLGTILKKKKKQKKAKKSSNIYNWIKCIFIRNFLKSPPVQEEIPNVISLHRESQTSRIKSVARRGFLGNMCLKGFRTFPFLLRLIFCNVFMFVCFFPPTQFCVKGRQDCESGHWPWSFPAAWSSCTHLTWDLDSIRALKWLLLMMDFASSSAKANSPWCAFLVSPTLIHAPTGVLFSMFYFLSFKTKSRNEVGTLDQIRSSARFKDFRWSRLISPDFRCLNEKWPSEGNDCTFPLIWQTPRIIQTSVGFFCLLQAQSRYRIIESLRLEKIFKINKLRLHCSFRDSRKTKVLSWVSHCASEGHRDSLLPWKHLKEQKQTYISFQLVL